MAKNVKDIPQFNNDAEEAKFWEKSDTSEYFDFSKATRVVFPNLKQSTESISLRLPKHLLARLKVLANSQDVPYQSLIKVYLADRVKEEFSSDYKAD
jgi:predicted DNA binding CopG/RHH family protein